MGVIAEEVKKCVEVLRKGGVILYPTDTVWGIGCDASNADAVKRVFEIKRRCDSKAMLLLVDNADRIARYVGNVPSVAWDLVELTTKPLTIIYECGNTCYIGDVLQGVVLPFPKGDSLDICQYKW